MIVVLVALLMAVLASCSDAHTSDEKNEAQNGTDPRVVTVFEPTELLVAMKALTEAFSKTRPDTTFVFESDPVVTQRQRIADGARPGLWIDQAQNVDAYAHDPRAQGDPVVVGWDVLQFIVKLGNPKRISKLTVFGVGGGPNPGAKTSVCKLDTRCGAVTNKLLVSKHIDATPTVKSPDGDALVQAVLDTTVDAGLVFRTSAAPFADKLTLVPYDPATTGLVEFHMLRFTNNTTAEDFQTWLTTSDEAKRILLTQGLLPEIKATG